MTSTIFAASVDELATAIENGSAGPLLSRDVLALHLPVFRSLAEGTPASPEELAAAVGRTPKEILELIDGIPEIETDRYNRVLGLAVTLVPTRHRIHLRDRDHLLYAWCIPDTFMAARLLGEPLRVTSSCPATGESIELEVEPTGIRAVDPPDAVMSFVTSFDPDDARATGCGHMNLFVSPEAATNFQAGYPHVVNVAAADVFDELLPAFDAMDALRPSGHDHPRPDTTTTERNLVSGGAC